MNDLEFRYLRSVYFVTVRGCYKTNFSLSSRNRKVEWDLLTRRVIAQ